MVDSAATGTSRSVPHWKQVILRFSTAAFSGGACTGLGGALISSRRKWPRHFLQTVEYAPTGSRCECPHFGQVTVVVLGAEAMGKSYNVRKLQRYNVIATRPF